jgi:hypothetical protein
MTDVHAGAVFAVAGFERALVGVQPRVVRQQGGVDVDQTGHVRSATTSGERMRMKAGADDQVGATGIDLRRTTRGIERRHGWRGPSGRHARRP